MQCRSVGVLVAIAVLVGAHNAGAQPWKGFYVSGFVGGAVQSEDAAELVAFDTNLDGTFADTVRTVAGVDAFSPGFCGGLALNATAAAGCTDDEDGLEVGGRVGYDWRVGRFVVGGLVDMSRPDAVDSVSAFSTTPAFYSFTREVQYVIGLRARAGVGNDRVFIYGTAGPAWARVEQRFTTSNAVNTFVAVNQGDEERDHIWGYQAGAGLEITIGGPVNVFGEYVFMSLDTREASTMRAQGPAPATNPFILVNARGTDLRRTDRFDVHALRAGISYRF